jgi:hypothetical protein
VFPPKTLTPLAQVFRPQSLIKNVKFFGSLGVLKSTGLQPELIKRNLSTGSGGPSSALHYSHSSKYITQLFLFSVVL